MTIKTFCAFLIILGVFAMMSTPVSAEEACVTISQISSGNIPNDSFQNQTVMVKATPASGKAMLVEIDGFGDTASMAAIFMQAYTKKEVVKIGVTPPSPNGYSTYRIEYVVLGETGCPPIIKLPTGSGGLQPL